MSKYDLKKLAEEAKQVLQRSKQDREEFYNKQPHLYTVNRQTIIQEALVQVGKTRSTISEQELKELTDAATRYCERLYTVFHSEKSNEIQVFAKSKVNFYAIISSDINVYRKISAIRIKGGLRKFTNDLNNIFPDNSNKHSVAFDIGHKAGNSIAELTIQKALARFISIPKVTGQGSRTINRVISLAIRSYEKVDVDKSFFIEVKDESAAENQGKGSRDERKWIRETRDALNSMLSQVDWANQRGSRSAVEAALSSLLKTSKKSGAKVSGTIYKRTTPSSVKVQVVSKSKVKPTQVNSPLVDSINIASKNSSTVNWVSLISIINSKLPQKVAENMTEPGLVYRTGRFANSTKIVGIKATKEGYPSIVFDYQRSPYDVFDRLKGKSPWNTPARDPRALVDKSVRELVQEMAIGRFYTRRA